MDMKLNQKIVDQAMMIKSGNCGEYSSLEILTLIRKIIKEKLNIEISNTEAHVFWRWRSALYDASFLTLNSGSEKEVIEFFELYCKETLGYDFDYEEANPYDN